MSINEARGAHLPPVILLYYFAIPDIIKSQLSTPRNHALLTPSQYAAFRLMSRLEMTAADTLNSELCGDANPAEGMAPNPASDMVENRVLWAARLSHC